MRLAVFGATGRLGSEVVRAALTDGHEVVAHARSPDKVPAGATVVAASSMMPRSDGRSRGAMRSSPASDTAKANPPRPTRPPWATSRRR